MTLPATGITAEPWVCDLPGGIGAVQVLAAAQDAEFQFNKATTLLAMLGIPPSAVVAMSAWRSSHGF